MCQALRVQRTVQLEDQVLWRRDGTSFRADYTVYPVIQHGVVTGSIATFVDVATRQQARDSGQAHCQALAEAEYERDRLQRLVAQAPIFCYLAGPEHVHTLANESYRRVIGGRDPIGKPLREVLPEFESQGIIALLDRVFTTGEPFTGIEMPVMIDRNGNGTLEECFFTFLYQPDIGQDGKIDGIAVYGFEVTDQVRARRETEKPIGPGGERMELLAEVSHLFAEAAFDQQAILDTAARYGGGQTGDTCAIRLLSDDDKWLVPVALYSAAPGTRHHVSAWLTGSSLPVDAEHGLWMAQADEPLSIRGYTPEEYRATIGPAARFMEQLGAQSILVVPLRARNQVVGLMSVLRDAQAPPFPLEDRRFLQALADRTALALLNARLYQQLGDRRQQCQVLVGRLLLAQEKERQRLAYELHEDLAQIAASAYQHLQAYASRQPITPASNELDQTAELMRRTIQEARRIVSELRPTVLDDFGLSAAIRLQVEELRATGWQIIYREATRIERLPAIVETAIFRFVQEALQNVRKHAGTTRVEILLEQTDQTIRMEVQDRGRGFRPEASISQQVGLASIRAWVTFLDGHFLLDSQPGGGTRLWAEIPLRED
jgi:signal transduction histidine kinase/PAS domain-containing protein